MIAGPPLPLPSAFLRHCLLLSFVHQFCLQSITLLKYVTKKTQHSTSTNYIDFIYDLTFKSNKTNTINLFNAKFYVQKDLDLLCVCSDLSNLFFAISSRVLVSQLVVLVLVVDKDKGLDKQVRRDILYRYIGSSSKSWSMFIYSFL